MKHYDYIVVGCGLAGIAFCEKLKAEHKSFCVFDNGSQQSSIVAAGLYNPVILKRFSKVWKAQEQLNLALPVYSHIEQTLEIRVDYQIPVLRRFSSVEEQNQWLYASDKPGLCNFMAPHFIKNDFPYIDAPFGFGEVMQTGRVDTAHLVHSYKNALRAQGHLTTDAFDYKALLLKTNGIQYNTISADYLVCAEGFGVKQNPYFKELPINGTKGEVLTLHIPQLKLDEAIKSSVFIIPIGEDLYRVGSTYNWRDKSNRPTVQAKQELLEKLSTFIKADFTVVDHSAGIRPTVKDRRPVIGAHHNHKNVFILNGLGSRGVMIAPYVAEQLFNFIQYKTELDPEISIERFQ
jgi:glycine oxidase